MPTNDKRKEAATRLRESREFINDMSKVSLEHNAFDAFECILACLGYKQGNIFDHLANLIEPEPERTCKLKDKSWDERTCVWGIECSECGSKFSYETGTCWKYCPSCGAKVVE